MIGHRCTPVCAAAFFLALSLPATAQASFQEVDLVSDLSGRAQRVDASLVNPWGLVQLPDGVFRVADNGTGTSTAYGPAGVTRGIPITIPPPGSGNPTGLALNLDRRAFQVPHPGHKLASRLIFVSEDGSISAWGPGFANDQAITVWTTPEAVYKGVALARAGHGSYLYAVNFHAGTIDVFDDEFVPQHWSGAFRDPDLPQGFAPYNILEDRAGLYVAFAMQDQDRHDDVPGAGLGYVDLFDRHGKLLKRVASQGTLNAPWGMAIAPGDFGPFGGALLVGNFGDGRISAFNRRTGTFLGQLSNASGEPISIDGLWSLVFSGGDGDGDEHEGGKRGKDDDDRPTLYFTAGIDDEAHGLFGILRMNRDGKQHAPKAAAVAAAPLPRQGATLSQIALVGGNLVRASQGRDVTFSLTLSGPTRVSLDVFDVSGRRVAEPMRDAELSGSVDVRWDRRDERGARVAPGTYFYRAVAGSDVTTGRLVIMR